MRSVREFGWISCCTVGAWETEIFEQWVDPLPHHAVEMSMIPGNLNVVGRVGLGDRGEGENEGEVAKEREGDPSGL